MATKAPTVGAVQGLGSVAGVSLKATVPPAITSPTHGTDGHTVGQVSDAVKTGRPMVGRLVVPFVVDETRTPINFAMMDKAHVALCATDGRCGVCGRKIRKGPIAFVGPDDGRRCFADPWMHLDCAGLAQDQCPFLSGKRGWRSGGTDLTQPYADGMVRVLAYSWRAHQDAFGAWHFEALGPVEVQA